MFVPNNPTEFPDFENAGLLVNLLRRQHGRKMLCARFHLGIESLALRWDGQLIDKTASFPATDRDDVYRMLAGPTAPPESLFQLFNREIRPDGLAGLVKNALKLDKQFPGIYSRRGRCSRTSSICLVHHRALRFSFLTPAVDGVAFRLAGILLA